MTRPTDPALDAPVTKHENQSPGLESHSQVVQEVRALDPKDVNLAQQDSRRGKNLGYVQTQALLNFAASPDQNANRALESNTKEQNPNAKTDLDAQLRDSASPTLSETESPFLPEVLGGFPTIRLRRNRKADWVRRMVAENQVRVEDFIWPIFVQEENGTQPIKPMPGVSRYGPDTLLQAVNEAYELGIPCVALFPEVSADKKTTLCDEAVNPNNLICRSVRLIKETFEGLGVLCDVALDPYNSLGQDGIVDLSDENYPQILNDETLEILIDQALIQAQAGCDILGPSDMMDGRIGAIRTALDEAGYQNVSLMSYAAKYASAFYGPFRDAIGSSGALIGDKKTYQMDPANGREALREARMDMDEGADMLLVKPGMPYLDVIQRLSSNLDIPVFAYQVSGEYAMLAAAAESGWLEGSSVMMESLLAFKRAGASGILTYAAVDMARELSI